MKIYVDTVPMKWHHREKLRDMLVQRELGEKLYQELQQDYIELIYEEEPARALPHDRYKEVHVYAKITDAKKAMWFALKNF